MAELASAMPDEGGYVTWTTRAFGPFWGFQVGWWSWLDSFVDVAVYPALFVEYLRYWHPTLAPLERWLLALAFIVALTTLNLLGVRPTGRAAVALAVAALAPVALLVAVGLPRMAAAPWTPFTIEGPTLASGLGLGLAVVMWNYAGWDTPSTVLGETRAPEHAFRRALLLAVPLVGVSYVLPVGVVLASGAADWTTWTTGALPALAARVGGAWLGHAVAAGAVLSTAGLFMALLLTNSRLPYVPARAGQVLVDDVGEARQRRQRVDIGLPAERHVVGTLAGRGGRVDAHVDVRARAPAAARAAVAHVHAVVEAAPRHERAQRAEHPGGVEPRGAAAALDRQDNDATLARADGDHEPARRAHGSTWEAPRWPPRSFKRKGLRPPRTPPGSARSAPGDPRRSSIPRVLIGRPRRAPPPGARRRPRARRRIRASAPARRGAGVRARPRAPGFRARGGRARWSPCRPRPARRAPRRAWRATPPRRRR